MKSRKLFLLFFGLIFTMMIVACTKTMYTVTFNTDGGSDVQSVEINENGLITRPTTNPEKANHTFINWFEDADKTILFKFETFKVTEDIVIYAKWKLNEYTVEFDTDGGTSIENVKVDHDGLIIKPNDPEKPGFSFRGWYKDDNRTDDWNFAIDKVTQNIKLYAKWEEGSFLVKFDTLDGKEITELVVDYDELIVEPVKPTRTGYSFIGWFLDENDDVAWNFTTDKVLEDITLYAKWELNEYTVEFDTDGGSLIDDVIVNHNELVSKPTDPTKDNNTFQGWFRDEDRTIAWNFDNNRVTSSITLYAKWAQDSIPVILADHIYIRLDQLADYDFLKDVIARDDTDGDITKDIIVNSDDVLQEVGEYEIVYSVTNSQEVTTEEKVMVYVDYATKLLPELDTRDFSTKVQWGTVDYIANFEYDEIEFIINSQNLSRDFEEDLQIYFNNPINLNPNTKYRLMFNISASKDTSLVMFLQRFPVDFPYANILNPNQRVNITTENQMNSIDFTTSPDGEYWLEIQFRNAFENFSEGEPEWIKFSNFIIMELEEVQFNSNGGSLVESQWVIEGEKINKPIDPIRAGYNFVGWSKEELEEVMWDFEIDTFTENLTLFAVWEEKNVPDIIGFKDLVVRLNELANLNYLDGVTAADSADGDLTDEIVVDTSNVLAQTGVYEVTYSVENSAGEKREVIITLEVIEATKEYPVIDNRDFFLTTQNLSRPVEEIVEANFGYDKIRYDITNYGVTRPNNGNLQIATVLENRINANTRYLLTFKVFASKEGSILPYLQIFPVDDPWFNIMENGLQFISDEETTVSISFTTGQEVAEFYNLSIEFGQFFQEADTGWIEFSDIVLDEAHLVAFDTDGGSTINNSAAYNEQLVDKPLDPEKMGFVFGGWFKDEERTIEWNFEEDLIIEDTTIFAKWEVLLEPVIYDYKDLEVRLNNLDNFDFKNIVKATDATDGDLTSAIVVNSSNVLAELGVYEVIYTVTNSLNATTTVTVNITVTEATKENPELDTRDFQLKTQNLSRPVEDMVSADFSYDKIRYDITNYATHGSNNGNLQIEMVLKNLIEANTTYTLSFNVISSKEGSVMPYLQVFPVDFPWANIMGNQSEAVTTEVSTITIEFTTGENVASEYSFSVEFGQLFSVGETGWIEFSDFIFAS